MADNVLKKGTKFPVSCVNEVFNAVKGKSSLAVLSQKVPVKFNGNRRFVFSISRDDLPRLIEYLEGQKNWTEYFIMLVEQDMMHKGVEPDEFIFSLSDRAFDE